MYTQLKSFTIIYNQIKIITDHKPNVNVLNKRICEVHSPRLQKLRLKLLKYDIQLEYFSGKYLYVANCLSQNYSNEIEEVDRNMNEIVRSVEKHLRMSEERKEAD